MSANTKIEWADHTFNPWEGCTKVSPGSPRWKCTSWRAWMVSKARVT
ncbi:MAG: DUF5131 family protein [Opitutaceae bacterium]|nr:DUF5131 family protein [Opitutaceae bacterium]